MKTLETPGKTRRVGRYVSCAKQFVVRKQGPKNWFVALRGSFVLGLHVAATVDDDFLFHQGMFVLIHRRKSAVFFSVFWLSFKVCWIRASLLLAHHVLLCMTRQYLVGGLRGLYWNYIIESLDESSVTTTRAVQKNVVLTKGSRLYNVRWFYL